jgi:hypothetical protein
MHDLIPLAPGALTTELAAELGSADDYAAASLSESTRRAYAEDAVLWRRWCDGRGLQALPAQAEAVAAHIASMADAGLKPATIAPGRSHPLHAPRPRPGAADQQREGEGDPAPDQAPRRQQVGIEIREVLADRLQGREQGEQSGLVLRLDDQAIALAVHQSSFARQLEPDWDADRLVAAILGQSDLAPTGH